MHFSRIAWVVSLALSGCGIIRQAEVRQFGTEARAVMQDCRNKRLAGELRGYVASAQCSNPRLAQLAAFYRAADGDVVALFLARRLEIAERMDAGKLTEAQGQVETSVHTRRP
jgi:hypothetical protein